MDHALGLRLLLLLLRMLLLHGLLLLVPVIVHDHRVLSCLFSNLLQDLLYIRSASIDPFELYSVLIAKLASILFHGPRFGV